MSLTHVGCSLCMQITPPSGRGFMMGVTPQIMSRAVLDPMVLYLENQVRS